MRQRLSLGTVPYRALPARRLPRPLGARLSLASRYAGRLAPARVKDGIDVTPNGGDDPLDVLGRLQLLVKKWPQLVHARIRVEFRMHLLEFRRGDEV